MDTCVRPLTGAEGTDRKQNKLLPFRSSCFTVSMRGCGVGVRLGQGMPRKKYFGYQSVPRREQNSGKGL